MINKIIKVDSDHCGEVLLTICRCEDDGEDYVDITAWHTRTEDTIEFNYFQRESVEFDSFQRCERFIADYSTESAQAFVDSFDF